jgi:tetratricopeptide (TPR) repeat protein
VLLTDNAKDFLTMLLRNDADPGIRAPIESMLHLLQLCREVGVDSAFESLVLEFALRGFIEAHSPRETRRVLESHPELISDKAIQHLERLIALQGRTDSRERFVRRRDLLLACREKGLASILALPAKAPIAGAEQGGGKEPRSSVVSSGLAEGYHYYQRYHETRDERLLDATLMCYRRASQHPDFDAEAPLVRASAFQLTALALLDRNDHLGGVEDIDRAIDALDSALDAAPATAPERAHFLDDLGQAWKARYRHSGRFEDLDQAITQLGQALEALPPSSPDRPRILNDIGLRCRDRFLQAKDAADLDTAVGAFREALTVSRPGPEAKTGLFSFNLV